MIKPSLLLLTSLSLSVGLASQTNEYALRETPVLKNQKEVEVEVHFKTSELTLDFLASYRLTVVQVNTDGSFEEKHELLSGQMKINGEEKELRNVKEKIVKHWLSGKISQTGSSQEDDLIASLILGIVRGYNPPGTTKVGAKWELEYSADDNSAKCKYEFIGVRDLKQRKLFFVKGNISGKGGGFSGDVDASIWIRPEDSSLEKLEVSSKNLVLSEGMSPGTISMKWTRKR